MSAKVKTDAELATEYKARLDALLRPVCELITEAKKKHSILLNYTTAMDNSQCQKVTSLTATKEF